VAGAPPATNGRTLYKWVDQQGVTHYGDHIPPEYAAQEHDVINAQGVEISRLEAQKTPEQLALEDQKKADAQQRQHRDLNLLNTYASVQEIERLRDQRMTLVTDQIKVTSQFLEVLNGKLKKLRAGSAHFKPYSSDPNALVMPDQFAEDLVRVRNDIRTQEENLAEKRAEETTMRKEFDTDIIRFKELKGIH
jgi:murein tripeptide amidase MpaA